MKNKPQIYSLIGTLVTGFSAVIAILLIGGIFSVSDKPVIFTRLSDAFFIVGIIIFGIGGLILIAQTGFFDMIAYGVRSLFESFSIRSRKDKHVKYYDYVERKREARQLRKESSPALFIFLVGVLFIAISAFFLIFI